MAVKVKVSAETRSAENSLKKINKQLGTMTKQGKTQTKMFGRLGRSIAAAFSIGAVVLFIAKIKNATDSLQRMQNLLKSSGVKSVADGMGQVYEISKDTRGEMVSIGSLFAKISRSSSALGASQQDVADATRAVAQSLQLSGASTVEATSATVQLGQALASGRLAGDELRSILESAPILAQTIAESIGATVGEMRELASQGKLTSKVVFDGILSSSEKINKEFKELSPTIGQSMQLLDNGITVASAHFGSLVVAALGLNDIFKEAGETLADWGDGRRFEGLKDAIEEIDDAIERIGRRKPFEGWGGNRGNDDDFAGILEQIKEINDKTKEFGSLTAYEESVTSLKKLIAKEKERLALGKGSTSEDTLWALRAQLVVQMKQVDAVRDIETVESNITKLGGIQVRTAENVRKALAATGKGLTARERIEERTKESQKDILEVREKIAATGLMTLEQDKELLKYAQEITDSHEASLEHLAKKNALYMTSVEAANLATEAELKGATIAEKVAAFTAAEAQTNATILKQLTDKGVLNAAQNEHYLEAVRLSGLLAEQTETDLVRQAEMAVEQAEQDLRSQEIALGGLTIAEERALLRETELEEIAILGEELLEQGVVEEDINRILRERLGLYDKIAEIEDVKKKVEHQKKFSAALGETGKAIMQLSGENKKAHALGKALAISEATINAYLGFTQAMSEGNKVPYVVKVVQAAAALASGLAAVSSIASQRKHGGSVDSGSMYQVGEGGNPEIFASGGKNYFLPGDSSGTVINNKKSFGSQGGSGTSGDISNTLNFQVTGNIDDATRKAMMEMADELADIVTSKQQERGLQAA